MLFPVAELRALTSIVVISCIWFSMVHNTQFCLKVIVHLAFAWNGSENEACMWTYLPWFSVRSIFGGFFVYFRYRCKCVAKWICEMNCVCPAGRPPASLFPSVRLTLNPNRKLFEHIWLPLIKFDHGSTSWLFCTSVLLLQCRLWLKRPMWEKQFLPQKSHLCVVSGLLELLRSFLRALLLQSPPAPQLNNTDSRRVFSQILNMIVVTT